MEVLEFPNGVCQKHGPKLNVNGISQCVKCVADAERALRAPAPVVAVDDPGHDAMGHISPDSRVKAQPGTAVSQNTGKVVASNLNGLTAIREAIYRLPMPKSLKQYKRFLKIQQLIDQAVEDENAEAD
jgi:hypothetical protein